MTVSLTEFQQQARAWLSSVRAPRPMGREWGQGPDEVAIFPEWGPDEERLQLEAGRDWMRTRYEAGFGGISFPVDVGGRGLTRAHELIYQLEEGRFDTPTTEIWNVGFGMVLPTILEAGTAAQRQRFVPGGMRGELLFCQMFSEPDAGSDLGSLRTSARRDGDRWIVTGRKVWTSMARGCDWGLLLTRTDSRAARHEALTMFMVRMDQPGIEVRPIRQMTGGASFNEVVLDGAEVDDDCRLGAVGGGWAVMLMTLKNERVSIPVTGPAASVERLIALADHFGCLPDPRVRDDLARLYIMRQVIDLNALRSLAAVAAGGAPGAEASISKLVFTDYLSEMSRFASTVLGPRMAADTAEWGTWAWTSHLMGSIGLHIGGGTDEIVKNMLAERVLGLPRQRRAAPS